MKRKKEKNYWKIALISLFVFFAITFLWSSLTQDNYIENIPNPSTTSYQEQDKISILESVVRDYHKTHTYSKIDLFVCTDTSIDIWNLVRTEGINAQICVGNIEESLSGIDFFNEMNHAWVIAEGEPFAWIALETTGGYLVWGEGQSGGRDIENNLYYEGECFDNPSELKEFITLRNDYFDICNEAQELIDYWNDYYVGETYTAEGYKFEGKMNSKREDCEEITNRLAGLLT